MSSERYQKIVEENKRFEKESPYNFCDRWCERCVHEKQAACRVYLDDLERKVTCIAHGKDEDDSEIIGAVLEAQYGDIEEKMKEAGERFGIDLDFPDGEGLGEEQEIELEDLPGDILEHIQFVEKHPLPATVEQYHERASAFLKENFYEKKDLPPEIKYHFETVSWYHILLPAKLQRALAGFHEPACEGELGFYDAVAQFSICKKSIAESIKALKALEPHCPYHQYVLIELLALLYNICDRITAMEESI
jgi:hypothetical protein